MPGRLARRRLWQCGPFNEFTVAPVVPETVAKRYAEGRVLIHYHAEIHWWRDPRPEMLCAVFYHAASKVLLSPDAGVIFGKLNRVTDPAGCDQRSPVDVNQLPDD